MPPKRKMQPFKAITCDPIVTQAHVCSTFITSTTAKQVDATTHLQEILIRHVVPRTKVVPLSPLEEAPQPFSPTPTERIEIRRPQLRIITDFSPVTSFVARTITPPPLTSELVSQWGSWQPQIDLQRERFRLAVATALAEYQWGVYLVVTDSLSRPAAPPDIVVEDSLETSTQESVVRIESEASSTVGFLDPHCYPWEL